MFASIFGGNKVVSLALVRGPLTKTSVTSQGLGVSSTLDEIPRAWFWFTCVVFLMSLAFYRRYLHTPASFKIMLERRGFVDISVQGHAVDIGRQSLEHQAERGRKQYLAFSARRPS